MKSDLDALMQDYQVDALLVIGAGTHNPPMVYLTGGSQVSHAYLIKLRGQPPVLFHGDMERDEAARTGLATRSLASFDHKALWSQAGGDPLQYDVARFQCMFEAVGLASGRVGVYGQTDAGKAFSLFSALERALPGLTFVGEHGNSLLAKAMATKDEDEVARIRRMGQVTTGVVGQVADFLTSQRVQSDMLVKPDGSPLTIGDVKRRIRLWLAEQEAENGADTIFAIGYDSAVPHSTGETGDPLRLGQTIIFDIFPCEAGGGYHYDFTRTWCLGYAPDDALRLYEDVRFVYETVVGELRSGAPTRQYMERACQLFEERGHPTMCSHPQSQQGFVHGLGHGLGLLIHEELRFSTQSGKEDILQPGVVMTVEPGLYYPERSMGVRLEDTYWLRPDGVFENLAPFPLDLVLPL